MVYVTHLDENEGPLTNDIIWILDDSFGNDAEPKWAEGRVEIRSRDSEDAKYRVSSIINSFKHKAAASGSNVSKDGCYA